MAYGDFKDLYRKTLADKVLSDKAFNLAKDPKYDGYKRLLASLVYKSFDKKLLVVALKMKIFLIKNWWKNYTNQLLETLIQEKYTVHSPFIDNIWVADLADIKLISKFNKGFMVLLYISDSYSKYAWDIPLKDKKSIIITNAFEKI